MQTRGYGTYRGRSWFRTFLKILIGVLLVLLVLLTAAFFFLEPHIIYSPDGIRIDLPFLQGQGGGGTEPAGPVDPLPAGTPSLDLTTPDPTPTPEPTPEPGAPFHGVKLAATALYDGTAQSQVDSAGGNAAVFDMKSDEGALAYISQLELALGSKVSATDGAINAAIQLLNTGELYTVARISCFRDNTVPRSNMPMAVKTSAGNWRDRGNYRWLSPANPEARAYVIGVCVELAGLGFDELLLDNCCFPTQGKVNIILPGDNYPAGELEGALETFFQELEAALAGYPEVKVSVMTSEAVLAGAQEDLSGQTAELLAAHAWRVWAPPSQEGNDYAALALEMGLTPERLVTIAGEVRPLDESWVVWES